jgi:tripartite-type tricarboxylate transporter receptor subunit TctC
MASFTRRGVIASAAAASAAAGLRIQPGMAQANYPARPITMLCPWGAGGGTDATARIVASLLEKDLGQPVNVINRTGGSGVVGHQAIASGQPDGYTLGILTVEISMMHWQGLTDLTPKSYTPLALMNEDPPGVHVKADAYKNVKELAEAIKKAPPGKLKASGTGQGGIWHLALVGWLQSMGLKPDHVAWVPSNGAAPGMQDLAAGGIDIVPCSLPEGRSIVEAGKASALAIMAAQRNPAFPKVPTLKEELGTDFAPTGAWRGFAGPKGLPQDVATKLVAAFKKVYESKEYNEFMSSRGFGVRWAEAQAFAQFMDTGDKQMGDAMKAAGLANT